MNHLHTKTCQYKAQANTYWNFLFNIGKKPQFNLVQFNSL